MENFLFFELDFVYFLHFFGLFSLAVVFLFLINIKKRMLPWHILSGFLLFCSILEFLNLFNFNQNNKFYLSLVLGIFANIFLFEFIRKAFNPLQIKIKAWQMYAGLIFIYIFSFCMKLLFNFCFTPDSLLFFIGIVLVSYILNRYAKHAELDSKNNLSILSKSFFVYSFYFIMPFCAVFSSLFNLYFDSNLIYYSFFIKTFFVAVLYFIFSFFIFQWIDEEMSLFSKKYPLFKSFFVFLIVSVFLLGWGVINFIGKNTEKNLKKDIVSVAKTASVAIDVKKISALQCVNEESDNPNYLSLSEQLQKIQKANPDYRYVYILVMKDNEVFYISDSYNFNSPNHSQIGDVYSKSSEGLKSVFKKHKALIKWPVIDRWGDWVSVFVPIYDVSGSKIIAVLGLDVTAQRWYLEIRQNRLVSMSIIFLLFIILMVLFFNFAFVRNASLKLIESEGVFKNLFDNAADSILVYDLTNFKILNANKFCLNFTGYSFKEIIGKPISAVITLSWEKFQHDIEMIKKSKTAYFDNYAGVKKNGTTFFVDITASLVTYNGVYSVLIIARDSSDKKLQETKEKIVLAQQKTILDNIPYVAWLKDKNGRYLLINEQFEKITGRSVSSILGKNDYDIWDKKIAQNFYQEDAVVMQDKKRIFTEEQIYDNTGREIWIERIVNPLYNDLNEVIGTVGIFRNITQRKITEKQLNVIQYSIDHVNDFIFWIQKNGNIFYANRSSCEVLGFDMSEITFITIFDIARDLTKDKWDQIWNNLINEKNEIHESVFYTKFGNKITVEINSTYLEADGFEYNCMFVRDISDRIKNEADLKLARFSVDKASIGIVWVKEDASFLFVNDAVCRTLGFSREEMLTKTMIDLDDRIKKSEWTKNWQLVKQSQQGFVFETSLIAKDGLKVPVEINVNYLEFNGNAYQCAFISDVTVRKNVDAVIKENLDFLQTVMDAVPIPVFYKDRNGVYTGCNDAFSKFIGFSKEQIIGSTVFNIAPKDLAEAYHAKDILIMEQGISQIYENKAKDFNGEYRDILFHKTVFFDKNQKVAGIVGVMFDVTERKKVL